MDVKFVRFVFLLKITDSSCLSDTERQASLLEASQKKRRKNKTGDGQV